MKTISQISVFDKPAGKCLQVINRTILSDGKNNFISFDGSYKKVHIINKNKEIIYKLYLSEKFKF